MPVLGQALISTQPYFHTQPVALAANGLDGGFLGAGLLQFLAQPNDLHFQRFLVVLGHFLVGQRNKLPGFQNMVHPDRAIGRSPLIGAIDEVVRNGPAGLLHKTYVRCAIEIDAVVVGICFIYPILKVSIILA